MLKLHIITPIGSVYEGETLSVTAPATEGEITVLPHHEALFTSLAEGVVVAREEADEQLFSIGGGYLETDGTQVSILVSRAVGQDEIDETTVSVARNKAQEMLDSAQTDEDRAAARAMLHHSLIDLSLLRRLKKKRPT